MALSFACASFNSCWYNLFIMRYVTTIYVFLTIAYLAPVHAADLSANKPNIIFILADDSGFADFGCYGHPYARTPNIDKLAADGTRFTQFYATGVTCCPTRTGLMTSKWPASYPTYPANGGFAGQVTITELLHKTAMLPVTSASGTSGQKIRRSREPMVLM